jgi:hypothetical protein
MSVSGCPLKNLILEMASELANFLYGSSLAVIRESFKS